MFFQTPRGVSGLVCAAMIVAAAPMATAGTIPVPAGGNLQAAIDTAQGGDVIALEPGATYVGNFWLRNKPGITQPIVIRSAAPDAALPGPGVRMTPAYAALLPKIKSPNTIPAIRTAAGAHHWTLLFLEFQANYKGYGDIITLGAGDSSQTDLSQVPYALVLDRLYIHGDPKLGQKRGVSLNSRDTSVVNSHITECKAIGQDTQAIFGFNGPGNYLIENNYLEAAGENFMMGGADPLITNLVPTNIVFRRNHVRKPLAWRDPIMTSPVGVVAAPMAGGALPAGTYFYKVAARRLAGQTNKANSATSLEVSATVGAGGAVMISWPSVPDAEDYVVYGRVSGAQNMYWTTTATSFVDTGAAGTTGTPVKATKWVVKNLLELKSAQDVVIESNVFENLWIADQAGYPIVFTPRNQNGRAPWTVVQRVAFRYNLVRHTAGGVSILGEDYLAPSLLTNHISIEHNVFDDMTSATWGAGSRFLAICDGGDSITVDHNTVMTTTSVVVFLYGGSSSSPTPITNVRYTNNMSAHNRYGFMGNNVGTGLLAIAAYWPGGVMTNNVLAGGTASSYPAGNFFPTTTAWQSEFVNYAAGDYHLTPSSIYKGAATDGTDLGADIDRVAAEAATALSGDNSGLPAISRIQIVTSSLPNGVLGQPYGEALSCTGGSGACAWSIAAGSLPQGLMFDATAAVIFGTPTALESTTVTIEACDATDPSNSARTTFSLAIDPPPFVVAYPPAPLGQVGQSYQLTPSVSGAVGSVTWTILSGVLSPGLSLDFASGVISGVPSDWGTAAVVLQALDSWSNNRKADASAAITIAPAPLQVGSGALAKGVVGAPYSAALTASGGTGTISWSLIAGLLPAGVALDANGVLSGTPTSAGDFAFTARATDLNWPAYSAEGSFSIRVDPARRSRGRWR
jgi:hypothetical protein